MNTSLLCLLVTATTTLPDAPTQTVYRPSTNFVTSISQDDLSPLVVRAQSSPFYGSGTATPPTYAPGIPTSPVQTYADPNSLGTTGQYGTTLPPTYQSVQPFGSPGITSDPWIGGGAPVPYAQPYGGANSGQYGFGLNGVQPYQYGWSGRYDFGMIADEGTRLPGGGDFGGFGILEVDVEKELVTPIWNNYVFSIAPQFNYRSWDGPRIFGGGNDLDENFYRFGLGLKLATPDYGGWNAEVGFNPGYATDFNNTDMSDVWQYDGHAVLFWRMNPTWMWAFGAAYWDRVEDLVIPYAGAVWTPNDIWEFRLIFPESRISMFLGTPFGVPTWLYARGEYHVESYAAETDGTPATKINVQMEDWRALGGLRFETGAVSTFAEVGWVFERDFKADVPGLKGQLHSGLMGRVGLRY
ncbi:MAG: hypothetical protein KDA93_18625 [Planctomycetaceae bacterium]|nr:hypothetical protein [Planctomycetaceae bacterium]